MKLFELSPIKKIQDYVTSYRTAETMLTNSGFIKLGAGLYGSVWEHPNLSYVLKIYRPDSGYNTFLEYVGMNPSNPHLPKFRGHRIRLVKGSELYAIRMEKLNLLKDMPDKNDAMVIISYIEDWCSGYLNPSDQMFDKMKLLSNQYPELFETFTEIYNLSGGDHTFDISPRNVMSRQDGTMVITDPLC